MRFKKVLALFLTVAMLLSFSTMFVSANTRSVSYPQSWVNVGESIQLTVSGVTSVSWATDNSNVAIVSATGKVTGVSRGTATITTNCQYANGNSETFTTYIDVYDNRGIVNGEEYYIFNSLISSGGFLPIALMGGTTNGASLYLSPNMEETDYQWRLTQQSNGKYTIGYVAASNKGMYANTTNNDVTLYTLGSSKTQFELQRVDTDDHSGQYLIRYNSYYVAASYASRDCYLTTTLSDQCYWTLARVDKGTARIVMTDSSVSAETYPVSEFENTFESSDLGYTAYHSVNPTPYSAYQYLQSDDILIITGEGQAGCIKLENTSGGTAGYIRANSSVSGLSGNVYTIDNPSAPIDLSSVRCVLYLTDNSGVSTSSGANLVDATYDQGAHFVLGLKMDADPQNLNIWIETFLTCIELAYTIEVAIDEANREFGWNIDNDFRCAGDINQYLRLS